MGRFFWECEGKEYIFDPNKRYLIYYRGNFSPPTKGHFSLVDKYINNYNVKYLVHQIADEKRHNCPEWLARKIWRIYIHELLPKDRVILKKCGSSLDVLDYVEDIDVVVYLRGNEKYDIKDKIKNTRERYRKLRHKLRDRDIQLDYIFLDRPQLNILSATKFVEAINKIKHKRYLDSRDYRKLRPFMPEELSGKGVKYVIGKLCKCDLK